MSDSGMGDTGKLDIQELRLRCEQFQEELRNAREDLDTQRWGAEKTNQAIKVLYKELENKNRELQKLGKLKSDFVNTVSHELRTPLTTIRESISQFLDGILGETTAQQREFFTICLEDVDRLKRIIDNLLDISKLEAGMVRLKRKEIDIVSLARGVSAAFALKAKSLNLEILENYSSESIVVYADRDAIVQVFTNLAGNALKFTSKGSIALSVGEAPDYVECCVADTGRGILEENLPKVFGKFQQFNNVDGPGEKGTGLGLSISKGIIELHQGKIWVESKVDVGTKFIFRLPKYSSKELCWEHLTEEVKAAIRKDAPLSVLILVVRQAAYVSGNSAEIGGISFVQVVEELARKNLRRQEDSVYRYAHTVLVVLPEAKKEDAFEVSKRIQASIEDYADKKGLGAAQGIPCKIVSFPEDGMTEKELCAKIDDASG